MQFPLEFDALDLAADELMQKVQPVNTRLKEISLERANRRRARDGAGAGANAASWDNDTNRIRVHLRRAPTSSEMTSILGSLFSRAMSGSGNASVCDKVVAK